jgi:hypothetical protein
VRLAFALALLAVACAGPPLDPGVLQGGVYENAAFDLRVTLPEGWAFLAPDEIERGVIAQEPELPSALRRSKASRARTTTLFGMVDRTQPPAPGRARHAVLAHAQRIPRPPPGLTSETLANELERGMREQEIAIEIGERRQAIVADRRFVVVTAELEHGGVRGRLDHYLRYEPDRLLVLTVAYPPEESAPPPAAIEAIRPLSTSTRSTEESP